MLCFSVGFIIFSLSFSLCLFLPTLALAAMMPVRLVCVIRRGAWTDWQSDMPQAGEEEGTQILKDSLSTQNTTTKLKTRDIFSKILFHRS